MFLNKYPVFDRGRILKLEMIENIRDFPRDILAVFTKDYSNGIIEGCEISISEEYLVIDTGLICFQHILYLLKEKVKIAYQSSDQTTLLKIKFLGEGRNKDFISNTTQLFFDTETQIRNDEMELCRFKLKEGARLRNDYMNLEDFATEYDTVNRIYVPYAGKKQSNLFPEIFTYFAKEAFAYPLENPFDIVFCITCLQEKKPERETILAYLQNRKALREKAQTNLEIYKGLVSVLREIKSGKQKRQGNGNLGRGILLD